MEQGLWINLKVKNIIHLSSSFVLEWVFQEKSNIKQIYDISHNVHNNTWSLNLITGRSKSICNFLVNMVFRNFHISSQTCLVGQLLSPIPTLDFCVGRYNGNLQSFKRRWPCSDRDMSFVMARSFDSPHPPKCPFPIYTLLSQWYRS